MNAECLNRGMDGRMDGRMDGWMDEWKEGTEGVMEVMVCITRRYVWVNQPHVKQYEEAGGRGGCIYLQYPYHTIYSNSMATRCLNHVPYSLPY